MVSLVCSGLLVTYSSGGAVGSAVFCPLLVHPLLECGVDHGGLSNGGELDQNGHGGLGREAERVYLSVQQCAN